MIEKLQNNQTVEITQSKKIILKIIAKTPLLLLHLLGMVLGIIIFFIRTKSRKRAIEFAGIAKIPNPFFKVMLSYADFARSILEAPWIWLNPPLQTLNKVFDDTSEKIFNDIVDHTKAKKPILFLGCHLGASEAAIVYLNKHFNSAILYQTQKNPWLLAIRELIHKEHKIDLIKISVGGIRKINQRIKNGGAIGISIDQTPYEGSGKWLPFFGKDANTMMLAPKIAQQQNIKIVFVLHLHYFGGFRIKLLPIDKLPNSPEKIAIYFNQLIEKHIYLYPEQYRWAYDRYRKRTR